MFKLKYLTKLYQIRSINSPRFIHKLVCKMHKAYLRHLTEENKFEFTFQYENPTVRVKRSFNLCRQSDEQVSTFVARIAANIEKEVKKRSKKQPAPIPVRIERNAEEIGPSLTCGEVFTETNSLKLVIEGDEYEIVINAPCVNSIALPKCLLTNSLVYPTKFDTIYTIKHKSDFSWFKSRDGASWSPLATGFIYRTRPADVGHHLKLVCTPKNETIEGPSVEIVSKSAIIDSPSPLPFEDRHKFTVEPCKDDQVRVVTYNILADCYADMEYTRTVLHPYCPVSALDLDYRKQLYTRELLGYNADLICLQEVDRKVYKNELAALFDHFGYGSDFCPKNGAIVEGAACFYSKRKFELIETRRVVISEEFQTNELFSSLLQTIKQNQQLFERFQTRSSVLQVTVLKLIQTGKVLLVGNTHLYFHPDSDHIRLIQGGIIVKYLENLRDELKTCYDSVALIICGDFNSTPECGIYELYTTGTVPSNHVDFSSNADETAVGVQFAHAVRLASACGTPPFTNFTVGFAACLDYIFYERARLRVVQSVPLPALAALAAHTALPSVLFPSDHLSLCADLQMN